VQFTTPRPQPQFNIIHGSMLPNQNVIEGIIDENTLHHKSSI